MEEYEEMLSECESVSELTFFCDGKQEVGLGKVSFETIQKIRVKHDKDFVSEMPSGRDIRGVFTSKDVTSAGKLSLCISIMIKGQFKDKHSDRAFDLVLYNVRFPSKLIDSIPRPWEFDAQLAFP